MGADGEIRICVPTTLSCHFADTDGVTWAGTYWRPSSPSSSTPYAIECTPFMCERDAIDDPGFTDGRHSGSRLSHSLREMHQGVLQVQEGH